MADSDIFKKPMMPPPKKRKQKVLPEEEYVSAMGDIIERDFYPDMKKMRSVHNELNDAENWESSRDEPGDFRISEHHSPEKYTGQKAEKKKLSLDQFAANFTSEDNAHFMKHRRDQINAYKEKYKFMFHEESNPMDLTKRLTVPSIREQSQKHIKPLNIDTWLYKNKNELMFPPEGINSDFKSSAGRYINHSNTRFTHIPFDYKVSASELQKAKELQSMIRHGKIGIDGKIFEGPANSPHKIVTTSPFLSPRDSPLLTWGEIGTTPYGSERTSTPSFYMQNISEREELALALADEMAVKKKAANKPPLSPFLNRHGFWNPAVDGTAFSSSRSGQSPIRSSPGKKVLRSPPPMIPLFNPKNGKKKRSKSIFPYFPALLNTDKNLSA